LTRAKCRFRGTVEHAPTTKPKESRCPGEGRQPSRCASRDRSPHCGATPGAPGSAPPRQVSGPQVDLEPVLNFARSAPCTKGAQQVSPGQASVASAALGWISKRVLAPTGHYKNPVLPRSGVCAFDGVTQGGARSSLALGCLAQGLWPKSRANAESSEHALGDADDPVGIALSGNLRLPRVALLFADELLAHG